MLVVMEGLPGAGKTTSLEYMASSGFTTIPEIVSPEPVNATEEFFMQNDLKKQRLADGAKGVAVMDRNFTSTLCYNFNHDKMFGSSNYKAIADRVERSLTIGELRQPDLYVLLVCAISTSLTRQSKSNSPVWSNDAFLKDVRLFYLSRIGQSGCPYVVINTDTHAPDEVNQIIKSEVRKQQLHIRESA